MGPLDGSLSTKETERLVDQLRSGEIPALVATHVLDDSSDIPELSVLIQMSGHFSSRRQEKQRLGRLTRWGPCKRKRWEESAIGATFYVLVHDGTPEARMRSNRQSALEDISHTRTDLQQLIDSSPLKQSQLFAPADSDCSVS